MKSFKPSTSGLPWLLRMPDISGWLARRRVALGFACGAVALVLARPTWTTWILGCSVAAAGEGLRIWAAGHLEKDREVTSSGPYQFVAHPLYAGSTIVGIGFAIAAMSLTVAVLVGVYLLTTMTAAVRREEAFLRVKFGEQYAAYRSGDRGRSSVRAAGSSSSRTFSLERARRNREHRAVAGFCVVAIVLGLLAALRR